MKKKLLFFKSRLGNVEKKIIVKGIVKGIDTLIMLFSWYLRSVCVKLAEEVGLFHKIKPSFVIVWISFTLEQL